MKWSITLSDFFERTQLSLNISASPELLVPLPEINPRKISHIQVMPKRYLIKLIKSVTLEGDISVKPYEKCQIKTVRLDPHNLRIGQTFVERKKYQALVENFSSILDGEFCINGGIAKKGAFIIFGETYAGENAVAHYLPPIVEATSGEYFLLDGVHRNFLVMNAGTTIESILIENVPVPLPCSTHLWEEIKIVDKKPPREERFFNLKTELFRNLKYIGIDG